MNSWLVLAFYIAVIVVAALLLLAALEFIAPKIRRSLWLYRVWHWRSQMLTLDENVKFTVYSPQAIKPGTEYKLLAFAHLSESSPDKKGTDPDPVKEVERQAEQILGQQIGDYMQSAQASATAVPRDDTLIFVPRVKGITFDPPYQPFRWRGRVQGQEFQMTAEPGVDERTLRGSLKVYLGWILLADINLTIRVSQNAAEYSQQTWQQATAAPYQKIFVSYSRKDTKLVDYIIRISKAKGDDYLQDVTNLRSGEVWDEKLIKMIEEANIFQLFWSTNSMHSPFVRREWEYALSLNRDNFVRPTYWEEPFPESPAEGLPPAPLSRLEFYHIPLGMMNPQHMLAVPVAGPSSGRRTLELFEQIKKGKTIVSAIAIMFLTHLVMSIYGPDFYLRIHEVDPVPTPTPVINGSPSPSPTVTESPSPSPTVTATPSPTASPTPNINANVNVNVNTNANTGGNVNLPINLNATPSPTATSLPTPTATPTPVVTPSPPPPSPSPSPPISEPSVSIRSVETARRRIHGGSQSGGPVILKVGGFVITLVNEGDGAARDLVLTLMLPNDVLFLSSKPTLLPQGASRQVFVWNVPMMKADERESLSVEVVLLPNVPVRKIEYNYLLTYSDVNGKKHTIKGP